MIIRYDPLESDEHFHTFVSAMRRLTTDPVSFKFLSYTLRPLQPETAEMLTRTYKEHGFEYYVDLADNQEITAVCGLKRDEFEGFELFVLVVDPQYQRQGIGQQLVEKTIEIAKNEQYACVNAVVFADNKNMLRLLLKNDFIPIGMSYRKRADGADLVYLRRYL